MSTKVVCQRAKCRSKQRRHARPVCQSVLPGHSANAPSAPHIRPSEGGISNLFTEYYYFVRLFSPITQTAKAQIHFAITRCRTASSCQAACTFRAGSTRSRGRQKKRGWHPSNGTVSVPRRTLRILVRTCNVSHSHPLAEHANSSQLLGRACSRRTHRTYLDARDSSAHELQHLRYRNDFTSSILVISPEQYLGGGHKKNGTTGHDRRGSRPSCFVLRTSLPSGSHRCRSRRPSELNSFQARDPAAGHLNDPITPRTSKLLGT